MADRCYVYIYEHKGKPIYVGIGSDSQYKRATDLKYGHPEVYARYRKEFDNLESLRIRIVVDKVPRYVARLIEATLIRELCTVTELFNVHLGETSRMIHLVDFYVDSGNRRQLKPLSIYELELKRIMKNSTSAVRKYRLTEKGKQKKVEHGEKLKRNPFHKEYNRLRMNLSNHRKAGKDVTQLLKDIEVVKSKHSQWMKENP